MKNYQKIHATDCPECGADLTRPGSVHVHFTVAAHEGEFLSQLQPWSCSVYESRALEGVLVDREDVVKNGYHAGSFCGCGSLLDELEPGVEKAEEKEAPKYKLTFDWTFEDVMKQAENYGVVITEDQANRILEENAEELAEIEGEAVSHALYDIISEPQNEPG